MRFTLKEPFGSFPIQLVMPVVPNGAGPGLRDHPVGTGPYQFVRFSVDDKLELKAFPGYFGGAPANEGAVLKVVPDEIMRALELRKGTVDMVVNDLAPDVVYQLAKERSVAVAESPGTDYAYIGFNMRDPVLSDRRVRHAIGYAVDRQAIVDYLRRGLARPAIGILPPVSWAFEPNVFQFSHDVEKSKALLEEAGYRDPDGDGPLPRLRLTLKVSTNEFIRLQAAVIQQDLKQVGIELDVRSYEFATLYADVLKGNFQLFTLQWVGVSDPDMLRRVFHSKQMPPSGFNRGYYENPEVDRLIDAAMLAETDADRRRLYGEAQKRIAEDAPYISLWYKTNVAVSRTNIEGVTLSPSADFTFVRRVQEKLALDLRQLGPGFGRKLRLGVLLHDLGQRLLLILGLAGELVGARQLEQHGVGRQRAVLLLGQLLEGRDGRVVLPRPQLRLGLAEPRGAREDAGAGGDHLVVLFDGFVEAPERHEGGGRVVARHDARVAGRIRIGGRQEFRQRGLELRLLGRVGAGQLSAGVGRIVGGAGGRRGRHHARLFDHHRLGQHRPRLVVDATLPGGVGGHAAADQHDRDDRDEQRALVLAEPALRLGRAPWPARCPSNGAYGSSS